MQGLLFHEATRVELRARAAETLAVFPVGATEQHGPHLPVGTDFLTVEYLARIAAEKASVQIPIIVTPTLPFGSSPHHLPFGGTLSLGSEAYYRILWELIESLVTDGFVRIFILNGHGGNNELIQLVARDIALKYPVSVAAASYWTIAKAAIAGVNEEPLASLPGHAGIFETSQILALFPELVVEPRPAREPSEIRAFTVAPTYRVETHGFWEGMDGFTDSPARASAEQGRRYLDAVVRAVTEAFVEFYGRTAMMGKAL